MSIENVFRFPTEDAARADPVVGAYWLLPTAEAPGCWRADVCVTNLKAWDSRQDVTDDDGNTTHTYWPGWRICIGSESILPEFSNHPYLVLMSDCYAREVLKGPQEQWLIYLPSVIDPADLVYLRISP